VEGSRARERSKMRWMDDVKIRIERKGLNVEEARMCMQDSGSWRRVVYA
jgi:hypothetical protein